MKYSIFHSLTRLRFLCDPRRNCEENDFVRMGAYHTIDLEMNQPFTLIKDCWDVIFLDRLTASCDIATKADLAAIVMHQGLANLCLVTNHMTVTKSKLEVTIPRKRAVSSEHDRKKARFYSQLLQQIARHIRFDVVKCVLLASPGFVRNDFFDFMKKEVRRSQTGEYKHIADNLDKFVLCHSSSGNRNALKEVLASPAVQERLSDTKAMREVQVLNEFFETLNTDPNSCSYGYRHVCRAQESGAIATLMITDELFRSSNVKERKMYVALVEDVREAGGEVVLFSYQHTTGEQLANLTGIAALLRFPLPEPESNSDDSDSDSDDSDDDDNDRGGKAKSSGHGFEGGGSMASMMGM